MTFKLKIFTVVFLSFIYSLSFAQKEGDRIIAVVGNDIILESDLQYQVQLYARQNQISQINPAIAQQIFQQMLVEKILYAKAEQDSISVKDEEVGKELDYRVKSLIDQFGSEQKVEQIYNMSLGKIRLTLKEDLVKKMMVDKLKRKKFPMGFKASDSDVRKFYEAYKDSIPQSPDEYELAHIYLSRKVSDAEKIIAKEKALKILDSLKTGSDFSALAKRNSDDSLSAINGGDLGFAKRGSFVKPFEDAVFTMKVDEISEVVETEFGYHIIKINEIKKDEVRSQHILVAYPKLESSDIETINFLKDLREKLESKQITFEDAAKQYSQDQETKDKKGYLGFVAVDRIDSLELEYINKLNAGELTNPVRVGSDKNYGYELIKLISKSPSHTLTIEIDYD